MIRSEFEARCCRNPHYSLRAFARDLGVLSSRLSDVLNRKQGLSGRSASAIAHKLGFNELEVKWFVTLVESRSARSEVKRKTAAMALETLSVEENYFTLRDDLFALVSDWYHFPILELTTLQNFVPDNDWIARQLGINSIQASQAVDRLIKLGLLQKRRNGKLIAATTFPASTQDIPSAAVKNFHTQMLEKAARALFQQDVARREFSANMMAIDPADLPMIKDEIKRFRRDLEKRYKLAARKKEVYCFAMQFFSLTGTDNKLG